MCAAVRLGTVALLMGALPVSAQPWWVRPTATSTPDVPPTPTPGPSCAVDLHEQEPAVPFDLLAIVEVQGRFPHPDPEDLLLSARYRACELGGDAVIVLYRRPPVRPGRGEAPDIAGVLPAPGLRVAVIRYR